ncbi:MAG: hypothetical protein APF80_13305 [Alphaproteobacteria bacterium BRH_c36]|nr:MAG: hypothetical protein APF80_13305 [Alphaproteobacteria bacterium BRH_c36]
MTIQSGQIGRKDQRRSARIGMPRVWRFTLTAVLAAIVGGALYLLAVRGDALLSDLAAIAALICG